MFGHILLWAHLVCKGSGKGDALLLEVCLDVRAVIRGAAQIFKVLKHERSLRGHG